jgi:hypothetical protein
MILLWGVAQDSPLANVRRALVDTEERVVFVDQRAVLETTIELCVGAAVEGVLVVRGHEIDLAEVTAAYLRPYGSDQLPAIRKAGAGSAAWQHAFAVDDALLSWAELTPALVVNRPSAMTSNDSKPYQAFLIRSFGFDVPDTLITTDPRAVREFWSEHGTIIYKSISGVRSIVARLATTDLERLERVTWCPTQFQQYIPGLDYRIHVVGDEVFGCEIVSNADDYRYARQQTAAVELRPYKIAEEIANRCRILVAGLGLQVAGVDLRCRPDGRWFCFEVNPSPAFSFYEDASGQPISKVIASLLTSGISSRSTSVRAGELCQLEASPG